MARSQLCFSVFDMALAIIEFSVSARLLPFQQTQIRTLGSLSGLSDKDSASPWFMLLAGWAKKRCLILVPFRESLLLEVVCANIFVEIKHFWLPRPKVIHVFELMPAEYTFYLKIILCFISCFIPSLYCAIKSVCVITKEYLWMPTNTFPPSPRRWWYRRLKICCRELFCQLPVANIFNNILRRCWAGMGIFVSWHVIITFGAKC